MLLEVTFQKVRLHQTYYNSMKITGSFVGRNFSFFSLIQLQQKALILVRANRLIVFVTF